MRNLYKRIKDGQIFEYIGKSDSGLNTLCALSGATVSAGDEVFKKDFEEYEMEKGGKLYVAVFEHDYGVSAEVGPSQEELTDSNRSFRNGQKLLDVFAVHWGKGE